MDREIEFLPIYPVERLISFGYAKPVITWVSINRNPLIVAAIKNIKFGKEIRVISASRALVMRIL